MIDSTNIRPIAEVIAPGGVPDDRAEAEGDQRHHGDEQRGADDRGEHMAGVMTSWPTNV